MPIQHVIHPVGKSATARRIKRLLGASASRSISSVTNGQTRADWQKDFFLAYPPSRFVDNADSKYELLRAFYCVDKAKQREYLFSQGVSVPDTNDACQYANPGTRFVVRPLRHFGGQGFRVTDSCDDYNPSTEYISTLINKKYEYRAVFCKGVHVCTYRKDVPADTAPDAPWNHSVGARFVTTSPERCRLRAATDFFPIMGEVPVIKHASLCAVDVMLTQAARSPMGIAQGFNWFVSEVNLCPGITLENTLSTIKDIVGA